MNRLEGKRSTITYQDYVALRYTVGDIALPSVQTRSELIRTFLPTSVPYQLVVFNPEERTSVAASDLEDTFGIRSSGRKMHEA